MAFDTDLIRAAVMLRCFVFFLFFPQEAETGFVPSVQDFDKKLAEADAYLQILIDQLKVGLGYYRFTHIKM